MLSLCKASISWLDGDATVAFGTLSTIGVSAVEIYETAQDVCPISPMTLTYEILRLVHPQWEEWRCEKNSEHNLSTLRARVEGWQDTNLIALLAAARKINQP